MSTPNDPYLTVPNYGQQNQNFGKEKMYSGYTAPSAVSDLAAAAAASNLQIGARTPDKGKYVYDPKTGQYIWVPATAAAAVSTGLAASPAYMNQDRSGPGGGSELGATGNNTSGLNPGGVNTNKGFIPDILSSAFVGRIANALGSKQDPTNVTVEDRTGTSVSAANAAAAGLSALGANSQQAANNMSQNAQNAVATGSNVTDPAQAAQAAQAASNAAIGDAAEAEGVALGPAATGDVGGGGGGGGSRVICTHFYRKGEMDRDMWRADLEFTFKHLSPTTVRGYQYWAIPYVKLMRKSKLAEDIIRPLAFARAKELTYQMGRSPKGSIFGKVVRLVCEPICFAVGLFVGEQNWQALWTPVKD